MAQTAQYQSNINPVRVRNEISARIYDIESGRSNIARPDRSHERPSRVAISQGPSYIETFIRELPAERSA